MFCHIKFQTPHFKANKNKYIIFFMLLSQVVFPKESSKENPTIHTHWWYPDIKPVHDILISIKILNMKSLNACPKLPNFHLRVHFSPNFQLSIFFKFEVVFKYPSCFYLMNLVVFTGTMGLFWKEKHNHHFLSLTLKYIRPFLQT